MVAFGLRSPFLRTRAVAAANVAKKLSDGFSVEVEPVIMTITLIKPGVSRRDICEASVMGYEGDDAWKPSKGIVVGAHVNVKRSGQTLVQVNTKHIGKPTVHYHE